MIEWENGLKIIWKERNKTKNEMIRKIKNMEKNTIRNAIDRLIDSQESNPKAFYNKMRGTEDRKKGIENVTYEKEEIIKIANGKKKVIKITKLFWENLFKTKQSKSSYTPYWLKEKSILKWKSKEITKEIQISEIKLAIENMGNNKTAGMDKVSIEIYKDMPDEFLEIIKDIFNLCMKHKTMPTVWKEGVIFPIYKKGDESELTNYRPIALLQTQYKVYFSIINNRMTKQMYENGFFSKYQGAWQKDKITTINATTIINMYEEVNQHTKEIHTTYIDLVKAYDSVEH
jgi:hypothetical protein